MYIIDYNTTEVEIFINVLFTLKQQVIPAINVEVVTTGDPSHKCGSKMDY